MMKILNVKELNMMHINLMCIWNIITRQSDAKTLKYHVKVNTFTDETSIISILGSVQNLS